MPQPNIDPKTVEGFGEEWALYDQIDLGGAEQQRMFDLYFEIFPIDDLPSRAEGFDLGCGSGRWAELVAPRVGKLHCIDPSEKALAVARERFGQGAKVDFHLAGVDDIPLEEGSQDFGYSLGVLHHIPDPAAGLAACVGKLKKGAPFLLYLYYSFDNRPAWFKALWSVSDVARRGVSRLPFGLRKLTTTVIAGGVTGPWRERPELAASSASTPIAFRCPPIKTTASTPCERTRSIASERGSNSRFSRAEIEAMMEKAGLEQIRFRRRHSLLGGVRPPPLKRRSQAADTG